MKRNPGVFDDYDGAYSHAQPLANELDGKVAVAIDKAREFGQTVFRVKFMPWDPSKRFGWETRAEWVRPMRRANRKPSKLRGKAKAEFLARMARGRKAASKRRKRNSSTRKAVPRKRAGSKPAAPRARKASARGRSSRTGNPQLLTVNASKSRSRSRSRSASSVSRGRTKTSTSRVSKRSGKRSSTRSKRNNPQLLTVNPPPAGMRKALAAYRQFHGVDPKRGKRLGKRGPVLIALGELREIVYQPRRGQRKGPAFFHHFKAGNVLAVTADGKRLVIIDRKKKRKAVDFDLGIVS